MMSRFHRALTPEPDSEGGLSKNFQNRLILPLGSQEVTFTVPPSLSPMSPRRGLPELLSPMTPRKSALECTLLSPMAHRKSWADLLSPLTCKKLATDSGSLGSSNDGGDSELRAPSPIPGYIRKHSFCEGTPLGAAALGTLNPDLYMNDDVDDWTSSYPDGHIGRVWFSIEYQEDAEKLTITLIKAKNLPSRSLNSLNSCDPIIRIYLMPDERRCLQTKVKRKTCSPRYDETFRFQITPKELQDRTLKISFYDVVKDKKHHLIGHALYFLRDIRGSEGKKIFNRDLSKHIAISPLEVGELQVFLCYNDNLERLTVTVGDTKNLKIIDGLRTSKRDFQVKVSLLQQTKVVKSKKSINVKSELDPSFNESFIFKLPLDQLDISAISISLKVGKRSEDTLGRVLLGPFMFARGKAQEHWDEMLAKKKTQISMWHLIS